MRQQRHLACANAYQPPERLHALSSYCSSGATKTKGSWLACNRSILHAREDAVECNRSATRCSRYRCGISVLGVRALQEDGDEGVKARRVLLAESRERGAVQVEIGRASCRERV